MPNTYHFSYADTNVYGHIVSLVKSHATTKGIHLDLGCGFGAIAESIRDLGLTYIGFDFDDSGLTDLRARGFNAQQIDLSDPQIAIQEIDKIICREQLASISIIDTLEHITTGQALLQELRQYVDGLAIPLFISVPNVSHRDIGAKLLAGRWDYTEVGLLDHTHVIHHTDKLITAMTSCAGWIEVDNNDLRMELSDQCFPKEHILLSSHTHVGKYLRFLRGSADSFGTVNQLVRAYLPGPVKNVLTISSSAEAVRPFMSIITRTQGRRIGSLRDVLLCLTAQTCQDFEVLIIAHKTTDAQRIEVEKLIEDLPDAMRARVRFIILDRGARAAPLNVGFKEARGLYISILDDDDLVFAHWVETFKHLANGAEGCVLRTVAVEQSVFPEAWGGHLNGVRTNGSIQASFPDTYNLIDHLYMNQTPPMALAFPRSVFHDLNQHFDEELDTCEDWDFEMRAVMLCGVRTSPLITAIYHKWQSGESSFTLHNDNEWKLNRDRVLAKLDQQCHIFPMGTVSQLVTRRDITILPLEHELGLAKNWIEKLEPELYEARDWIKTLEAQLQKKEQDQNAAQNWIEKLEPELYEARDWIKTLEAQLQKKEQDQNAAQNWIEKLEPELYEARDWIRTLEAQQQKKEQDQNAAQNWIEKLESELYEARDWIKTLEAQIQNKEQDQSGAQNWIEKLESELYEARDRIIDLELRTQQLQNECRELRNGSKFINIKNRLSRVFCRFKH